MQPMSTNPATASEVHPLEPVLAVLDPVTGSRLAQLQTPILRADEVAATHGDGAFESMHVRGQSAWLLEAHLRRLSHSAAALSLTLPPRDTLEQLVLTAIAGWQERSDAEAGVKLVCARGPEYAPELGPTAYALAFGVSDTLIRRRRTGIGVVSLSFGYPAAERAQAPWLLGGCKTLSYAGNMTALRHAAVAGFDDALFISADGYVLEGATSTVVWAPNPGMLCTTPIDTGILASITAEYLFEHAPELGLKSFRRLITLPELLAADGVWLCSSVRGIIEVTSIDSCLTRRSPLTPRLTALLGFPKSTTEVF
ncbi:MAG: aminotransferase IV [Acidimicrobiales bacterium]|nr:MAG: aminotransferase IV [Acidimicrobiales bacterium]